MEQETSANLIFQCDLLIIDDLGTEMINKFVISQLFQCLNERLIQERQRSYPQIYLCKNSEILILNEFFQGFIENYSWQKIYGDDIRFKKSNLT